MISKSLSDSPADRAAVGSSRIRHRALPDRARAISTTWRSPMRRDPTVRSGSMSDPRRSRAATACSRAARQSTLPRRVGQRPRQMFSVTVRGGASVSSWKTMRMPIAAGEQRRRAGDVAPVEGHPTRIRGIVADEDLHQRRLAGSVLAEEGENGAASRYQVDAVENLHAAERLPDAIDLDDGAVRHAARLRRASRGQQESS